MSKNICHADYPYFPFWVADFTLGVSGMTDGEVGMYLRLLLYQWDHGHIPKDRKRLELIVASSGQVFSERWATVRQKFRSAGNGKLRNRRLESVRADVEAKRAAQSAGGKRGAVKRWSQQ